MIKWSACVWSYGVCAFATSITSQLLGLLGQRVVHGYVFLATSLSKVGYSSCLEACVNYLKGMNGNIKTTEIKLAGQCDPRLILYKKPVSTCVEHAVTTWRLLKSQKALQISPTWICSGKQSLLRQYYHFQTNGTEVISHVSGFLTKKYSTVRSTFSRITHMESSKDTGSTYTRKLWIVLKGVCDFLVPLEYQRDCDTSSFPGRYSLPRIISNFVARIVHAAGLAWRKGHVATLCSLRCNARLRICTLTAILSMLSTSVSARPIEINTTPSMPLASSGDGADFLKHLLGSICLALIVYLVSFIGPKLKFRDEVGTSTIISFSCALSKLVGDLVFPHVWTVTTSGLSIGSSFWLARATISPDDSVMTHLLRYIIVAVLVYQMLYLSELRGQDLEPGFSATFPELSILGSVVLNALYNEKVKKLFKWFESISNGILAIFRLQRMPANEHV